MEHNPYQPPQANVDTAATGELAGVEAVRKQYLNHEASLRSVGLLYYLGGIFSVLVGIGMILGMLAEGVGADSGATAFSLGGGMLLLGLAGLQLWIGKGFRKLRSNIKIPATLFSVLGLFSFPVGTLINGYILYLIYSAKGEMVFSEEYGRVIEATPHIKYKTSIIVWLFLGLILVGIGAAILIPMINRY